MSDRGYKGLAINIDMEAIKAEIEAMKAENIMRVDQGKTIAYGEEAFMECSERLRELARIALSLINEPGGGRR